jgi:hypothetical protein
MLIVGIVVGAVAFLWGLYLARHGRKVSLLLVTVGGLLIGALGRELAFPGSYTNLLFR